MAPASLRVHRVSASRRSARDGSAALVLAAWDRDGGEEDPAALAARLGRARALGARGCTVWLGRDELPRALRLLGQLRAPPGPGLPLRLAFGSSAAGVPGRDLWPQLEALHLELVV